MHTVLHEVKVWPKQTLACALPAVMKQAVTSAQAGQGSTGQAEAPQQAAPPSTAGMDKHAKKALWEQRKAQKQQVRHLSGALLPYTMLIMPSVHECSVLRRILFVGYCSMVTGVQAAT